jgi:hypothetical protein
MSMAPFSLVDGGPLCRLFRRLGCVRPDGQTNYRKTALLIVAVAWGPLIVLALVESVMTGRTPVMDWGIHARLLVAIPLLFQAEASLRMRTRRAIDLFRSERWAGDQEDKVTKIVAAAARLRDAVAPEVILLGLAVIGSQAVVWRVGGVRSVLRQLTLDPHLIAPRYWYAMIALPVFQFLVYRTLWRWGIWTQLLWRLSRLPVQPIATHPDLAGGLAFLSIPSDRVRLGRRRTVRGPVRRVGKQGPRREGRSHVVPPEPAGVHRRRRDRGARSPARLHRPPLALPLRGQDPVRRSRRSTTHARSRSAGSCNASGTTCWATPTSNRSPIWGIRARSS